MEKSQTKNDDNCDCDDERRFDNPNNKIPYLTEILTPRSAESRLHGTECSCKSCTEHDFQCTPNVAITADKSKTMGQKPTRIPKDKGIEIGAMKLKIQQKANGQDTHLNGKRKQKPPYGSIRLKRLRKIFRTFFLTVLLAVLFASARLTTCHINHLPPEFDFASDAFEPACTW